MILAERAHAHNAHFAVCLNRQPLFDADGDFHSRGILWVNVQHFHSAVFWTAEVAHSGAGLNSDCEGKVCMIRNWRTDERATHREAREDQKPCGHDDDYTD